VETYNTAHVDMHSGQLRPGFAVKLRKRGAGGSTAAAATSAAATTAKATGRPRKGEDEGRIVHRRKGSSMLVRERQERQNRRLRRKAKEAMKAADAAEAAEMGKDPSKQSKEGKETEEAKQPSKAASKGGEKLNFTDTESLDMDILADDPPRHGHGRGRAKRLPPLDSAPADEVADDPKPTTAAAAAAATKHPREHKKATGKKRKVHVGVKFQMQEDEQSISKAIRAAERADAATKKPAEEESETKNLFADALTSQEEAEKLASMK
jgi:hypothetical protein